MDDNSATTTNNQTFSIERNEALERLEDRSRVRFALLPASVHAAAQSNVDTDEIAKKAWQLANRLAEIACEKGIAEREALLADQASQQAAAAAEAAKQAAEASPGGAAA